jgi:hypothetical protein
MEGSTSMMTEQQDVPQAGTSEAGVAKRTTVQQQQHRDAAHMEDDEEAEDTMLREERMSSLAGRGWRFDADIRDGVTVQESVVSSRYIHAALRPAVQPGFFVFTLMDQRRPPTEPPGQGGSGAVLVAQASENLQELVGLRAPQVLGKAIADLLASEEDMCRLIACLDEAKTRGMDTAPYRDPPRWMEISMPFIAPDAVLQVSGRSLSPVSSLHSAPSYPAAAAAAGESHSGALFRCGGHGNFSREIEPSLREMGSYCPACEGGLPIVRGAGRRHH